MGFNSQRRTDPHPYVWSGHSPINKERTDTDIFRKGAGPKMVGRFNYEYAPRPELSNSPNPILVAFREWQGDPDGVGEVWLWLFGIDSFNTYGGVDSWEHDSHPFNPIIRASQDQVDHARKVLARLENRRFHAEGGEL